ncbi:hypothetical protein ACQV2E_24140 [Pantoea allii]|uniref:hypothetical protein n=1 Tax=Pantoea allii TaxID=574096 RepID=UPI000A23B992|nr:hypothetical protein [Pantoea allii]MBW1255566.1 hypothetical protein [Pantoea allii]MBW1264643.1 hypothetical protein [Pantoea allii]MBW1286763.1 hypothetical protein [Pantoea allii]ORM81364.1 hypothetical protein HA38_23120 [Pantoea allii]PBK01794.1 hypothetical protein CMR03_02935 [Pantoea allii]
MHFFIDPPLIIGVIVSLTAAIVAFSVIKPQKKEIEAIKNWVSRDRWHGEVLTTRLCAWSKTEAKYGDEFFYLFNFHKNDLDEREYIAAGLVNGKDEHKIREGLNLEVKLQDHSSGKAAVISIAFDC